MDQLTALKELAKKVEAGTWDMSGFMPQHDLDILHATFSGHVTDLINITEHDSLDAAHSLHKAVLGDRWTPQWQASPDFTGNIVTLFIPSATNDESAYLAAEVGENKILARAWLLAIIKAKIQELEQ